MIRNLEDIDWELVSARMQLNGFAVVPGVLADEECEALKAGYDTGAYRKTVVMERYRFGAGEYKYFDYPLPDIVAELRASVYPRLAPVAKAWFSALNLQGAFPPTHAGFLEECRRHGQQQPAPLILKYGKGGFNTLHQDLYGEVYFPMQAVLFLSRPGTDYTGGEFVMTRQVPRAQSQAIVLTPGKGDMLIFTTRFKPAKGTRGYYRTGMKHGVSEVLRGERFTLGIIFHDAVS
jgi:hypothetical protein